MFDLIVSSKYFPLFLLLLCTICILLGAQRNHPTFAHRKFEWKRICFQIQLNDYNLEYGWEFFTFKKVFDSVEETDKAI